MTDACVRSGYSGLRHGALEGGRRGRVLGKKESVYVSVIVYVSLNLDSAHSLSVTVSVSLSSAAHSLWLCQ